MFPIVSTRGRALARALAWSAAVVLLAFVWLSPPAIAQGGHRPRISEDELRAAVVVAILRYTTWAHKDSHAATIRVCSFGEARSSQVLSKHRGAISTGSFELEIMEVTGGEGAGDCDVLLVGATSDGGALPIAAALGAASPLTICDGCDSDQVPSIVTLLRSQGYIRFEVDLNRARAAGLSFSSEMLELAVRVKMDAS